MNDVRYAEHQCNIVLFLMDVHSTRQYYWMWSSYMHFYIYVIM